jgi:chemotaxis protein MotB
MAKAAKAAKGGKGNARPIVIKKEEVVEGGHHGGAWKVAYADFVTAMMAFFLLMWLLNATSTSQRLGLADYFSKANVLNRGASGEGKPFGGSDPFDSGAMASSKGTIQIMPGAHPPQNIHPPVPHTPARPTQHAGAGAGATHLPGNGPHSAQQQAEEAAFRDATRQMRAAVDADKSLAPYAGQISITETPEGIKIQIIDSHDKPMFAVGSAVPAPATEIILSKLAPVLGKLAHPISIAGYTDARQFGDASQSNWQLSVERANATRAVLVAGGLPETDLTQVAGYADRELLHPEDPLAAANRRITITIAKTAPGFGPTQ